jgi:hypothetical protein
MRPGEYFPRFSASESVIYACISRRLRNLKWLAGISRQRQQYWHKGFLKQVAAVSLSENLTDFLERSKGTGFPYASHSINHPVQTVLTKPPHLVFAATTPVVPP